MVDLERVDNAEEIAELKAMISRHAELTGSTRAAEVLAAWDQSLAKFVKVLPKDYKRVLMAMDRVIASGLSGDEAVMAAFEENARDLARVGGN
jgi:glutamate synthase (ferredoxin)